MSIVRDLSGNSPATDVDQPAKGASTVSGVFSAVNSGVFRPAIGQSFNISLFGTSPPATVTLYRALDGINYQPVTYADGTAIAWTGAAETSWEEGESNIPYKLVASGTSATWSYRFSQ